MSNKSCNSYRCNTRRGSSHTRYDKSISYNTNFIISTNLGRCSRKSANYNIIIIFKIMGISRESNIISLLTTCIKFYTSDSTLSNANTSYSLTFKFWNSSGSSRSFSTFIIKYNGIFNLIKISTSLNADTCNPSWSYSFNINTLR